MRVVYVAVCLIHPTGRRSVMRYRQPIRFRFRGSYVLPASAIRTFGIFRTRAINLSPLIADAPISRSSLSEPKSESMPLYANQTVTIVPSGTRACVRWRRWYPASVLPAPATADRSCIRRLCRDCGTDSEPSADGMRGSVDRSGCRPRALGSGVSVGGCSADVTQVELTTSHPSRHPCATHLPLSQVTPPNYTQESADNSGSEGSRTYGRTGKGCAVDPVSQGTAAA